MEKEADTEKTETAMLRYVLVTCVRKGLIYPQKWLALLIGMAL